jgi:hypothetical protein
VTTRASTIAAASDFEERTRRAYFLQRRLFLLRTRGEDGTLEAPRSLVARWDGGTDARGCRRQSQWRRVVTFALDNDTDPVVLIEGLFQSWSAVRPPEPSQACRIELVHRLANLRRESADRAALSFDVQRGELRRAWVLKRMVRPSADDGTLWTEILADPSQAAGPLARYCTAISAGREDLAVPFRDYALVEYLGQPVAYERAGGRYLDDGFRADADQLRQRVLHG